jgi:FAD:protein FMN transferase
VARIAAEPGSWRLPDDAPPLLDLYRRLYEATGGAVSPLVGGSLERLGYDRTYSLRSAGAAPTPAWEDAIAWDGQTLTALRPVTIDVGAAGKGYLVDLIGGMLADAGHRERVVDGSGDIRHAGAQPIRVGLEHPLDTRMAIGVAEVRNAAICSSATNRRAWGDGLHHVIDPFTGLPTRRVIATWAVAATALEADGLSTALFFTEPAALGGFDFTYARMTSDGRVTHSPDLDGEMFA